MDQLSETFGALADPTRRAILARLALGETSVTELAGPFAMSMPAVSRHLKVLEKAGLIARGREAQWRPCKLRPEAMREANAWLEQYRQFWEESFDRLEEYLEVMKAKQAAAPGNRDQGTGNSLPVVATLSAAETEAEKVADVEWRHRKEAKKRRKKERKKAEKKLKKEAKKGKHQTGMEAQIPEVQQKAKKAKGEGR